MNRCSCAVVCSFYTCKVDCLVQIDGGCGGICSYENMESRSHGCRESINRCGSNKSDSQGVPFCWVGTQDDSSVSRRSLLVGGESSSATGIQGYSVDGGINLGTLDFLFPCKGQCLAIGQC